jgi:hypothetical protein
MSMCGVVIDGDDHRCLRGWSPAFSVANRPVKRYSAI